MRKYRIYLLHPENTYLPGVSEWLHEVRQVVDIDKEWKDWDIKVERHSSNNSFNVNDVISQVGNMPGPIVVIKPVQSRSTNLLRERARQRTVVIVESVSDSTDLLNILDLGRSRYINGEPFLPRKFVAAILIVRKLEKGRYWGGNAKGYLYGADLPKGRGVPQEFIDISAQVANDLLLKGVLIKKTSGGKTKYALNPKRKKEIYRIVEHAEVQDAALRKVLMRDTCEVSARLLELPQ